MKQFKMRVKEGQTAEAIQNYMFACGSLWCGSESTHSYLDAKYFFADGKYITYETDDTEYFNDSVYDEFFFASKGDEFVEVASDAANKPIVSDGGSSSYYSFDITNKAGQTITVETGDILRAMVGNDYDLSNIVKACRRVYEASQGRGKAGVSIQYDCNKMKYFADEYSHWHKEGV